MAGAAPETRASGSASRPNPSLPEGRPKPALPARFSGRPSSRVLLLLRKDLLRRWRSPLGVLAMVAFPLIFSAMMALAFGGGGDSGLPRARLLVEDRDDGLAGGLMKSFLSSDQVSGYLEVVEVGEEGRRMIADDEASALLVIPEGTTAKLFDGEPVTLEMIRNPSQTILPEVAEQIAAVMAEVMALGARMLRSQTEELGLDSIASFDQVGDQEFARLAISLRHLLSKGERYLTEPPMVLEVATLGQEDEEDSENGASTAVMIVLFILPGISVYALFVIGDQMMRDVLTEARLGTLSRQLSAPVTGAEILAAKVLVTAVVAAVALLILAAFAAVLAPEPVDFAGFAVLSLALVLAVTGFSALIYSLVRTESQGGTVSALVYLALAFSGGSFLPVDNMPAAIRAVAPLSPFYWGTEGFRDLLGGAGLAGVAMPVAILGGLGLLLLAAGAVLLQRKVLRGEAA